MTGMNAQTGKSLSGINHLRQSLVDILTTPIGTRVMRRDYGSRLYELVDNPMNQYLVVQIYAATAEAIQRWEPRFNLTRVVVDTLKPGHVELSLEGRYAPINARITLDGIEIAL